MHKHFKRKWFPQAIFFSYNAKYFQTLPKGKWWFFANSLRSILKLVHEVFWQAPQYIKLLGNLTIWRAVLNWWLFGPVISTIAFGSLFSSIQLWKRTELYWNRSKACFLNQTCTLCKILDRSYRKSCMWKRKNLPYKILGISIKHCTA